MAVFDDQYLNEDGTPRTHIVVRPLPPSGGLTFDDLGPPLSAGQMPSPDIFVTGAAPFGFAGPGSMNFDPLVDQNAARSLTAAVPPRRLPVSPSEGLRVDHGSSVDEIRHTWPENKAAEGGSARYINNLARSFANGAPVVGAFNDRINAAINATVAPALNPLFSPEDQLSEPTWHGRYDHSLRDQSELEQQFATKHPYPDALARLGGGIAASGGFSKAMPWAAETGASLADGIAQTMRTQVPLWTADAIVRGRSADEGADRGAIGGATAALRRELIRRLLSGLKL
jgi:hypothetical protein